jgi:hypothetical protein
VTLELREEHNSTYTTFVILVQSFHYKDYQNARSAIQNLVQGYIVGQDSSVGIAPGYGLDGPGIEFRWGRDFSHVSRPSLLYNGYRVVPGGKATGRDADHTPLLVPTSRKGRAVPLSTLWACSGL